MIQIQSLMFTALSGFAGLNAYTGSRCYPDIAPQSVARPYVVWQEINQDQVNDLNGSAETNGLNNYLIQVTSWSEKATQARDIDRQVRLAMIAASGFKSLMTGARAMPYERDTKLHGMQSDFSVWLKT